MLSNGSKDEGQQFTKIIYHFLLYYEARQHSGHHFCLFIYFIVISIHPYYVLSYKGKQHILLKWKWTRWMRKGKKELGSNMHCLMVGCVEVDVKGAFFALLLFAFLINYFDTPCLPPRSLVFPDGYKRKHWKRKAFTLKILLIPINWLNNSQWHPCYFVVVAVHGLKNLRTK